MKIHPYLLILFLSTNAAYGQSDTLYVNDTHMLSLIFPKPISRAVTGHSNYTLGYNQETPERVGLLQGNSGADSNLLVLTQDGLAYSYYLVYRKQFKESHRVVVINEAIGNVLPKKHLDDMAQKEKGRSRSVPLSDSLQYRKASRYFLEHNSKVLKSKRKNGIILRLWEMCYFGKETYVVLEIENKSKIGFEVNYIQIFKEQGSGSKKSSYQKILLNTLYGHRIPTMVPAAKKQKFVYVVPKVTLGSRENLLVELREKRGDREMVVRSN
ncbi:DUF4138 domain-containing protein [Galbibacter sp. PAP.153]|uniref:DUF4138 domain-containing protein n=1 Tax=Galbibacter sp. PAP.153 TaxID=3104623 RepID=UPI003009CA7D